MGATSSSQNSRSNWHSGSGIGAYPGDRTMGRNPNWRPPGSTAPNPNTAAGRASTTRPPPSATTISRPGAYTISRNAQGSPQVFRVTIPPNVGLNQEFQVYGECLLIT
jgi:hypothetical protein